MALAPATTPASQNITMRFLLFAGGLIVTLSGCSCLKGSCARQTSQPAFPQFASKGTGLEFGGAARNAGWIFPTAMLPLVPALIC